MEALIPIFRGTFGIACIIGLGWLLSSHRKSIKWKTVLIGLGLQVFLGVMLIKVPATIWIIQLAADMFVKIISFTTEGTKFVFGFNVGDQATSSLGFIFAIHVLPNIIFFSALTSALYYLGVLQLLVKAFAWVMARTMGVSGAEAISASANVFLGQTEAPLLVKPFVDRMSRSEIMCLMTGGMATIAGSVMAAYIQMLGGPTAEGQAEFATKLLTASVMNAPAAILLAKLLIPENDNDAVNQDLEVSNEKIGANFIDAVANGIADGLKLALNVGAMLIGFLALIALVNWIFSLVGLIPISPDLSLNEWVAQSSNGAFPKFSLEYVLGWIMRVFAWLIGVDWGDTLQVGSMLGTKLVANEFVAYDMLSKAKMAGLLSDKSVLITTFSLCGFANFSSIAIQIGGIGGIAPNQRVTLSQLGLVAVLGGTLATMLSGCIAGMLS